MIPAPKLTALREALERDGEVVFKNGSKVGRVVDEGLETDIDGTNWVTRIRFVVTRPAGGIARYNDDDTGLRNAYAMALWGPTAKEQPSGDAAMFGDDPPW